MRTKLVYVLTCAENATYIEQALMAIWSARYYNNEAHIVLLVDDLTNQLLVNKRAEVLNYITEKIVVPFDDVDATMIYRSRFIKTQVRKLVFGDFLFIDSDTITCSSLHEVDNFDCEVGAVPESNIPVKQFCEALYHSMEINATKMGWSPKDEQYYFSSGVLYAKDTKIAHELFDKWHQYWSEGVDRGVNLDQPSLAKANIECGHPIQSIDNKWNCVMFTHPRWAKEAYIQHYSWYQNMSFLFSKRVLRYIKENGLTDYIKQYVLSPTSSYIPFDCEFYRYQLKDYCSCMKNIYSGLRDYAIHIDPTFADYKQNNLIHKLLTCKMYFMATMVLLCIKSRYVKFSKKYKNIENICAK